MTRKNKAMLKVYPTVDSVQIESQMRILPLQHENGGERMVRSNTRDTLCKKLDDVIKESGATYGATISALKWLLVAYQDKGDNLLNGTNIQEVAAQSQNQSVKLP